MDFSINLKRIASINEIDDKTLVERTLKLSEECGEVAEAVLSSESAPGCAYKGKTKEDIAEECMDVIIMAASTLIHALSPGGTMDKIERTMDELLEKKLTKWETNCKEN